MLYIDTFAGILIGKPVRAHSFGLEVSTKECPI